MGLKDRLAARSRPTAVIALRVEDDTAARATLAAALADGAAEQVAAAQAALATCYEQLTVTALPPVEMEALLDAHPPTEEQRHKDKQQLFNPDTFIPALLAACIDSDIDEESWAEYITKGPLTQGETAALFTSAWTINYRAPDPAIPLE